MNDIILTHGFFLDEDPKEQEIMRPYPPLGLLYISAFLKTRGFKPLIFDSTFKTRGQFEELLKVHQGGVVGLYTTHMTRSSIVRQMYAAREKGLKVIVGGPDSGAYPEQYIEHGADLVVNGEGEAALAEILPVIKDNGLDHELLAKIKGLAFRDKKGNMVRTKVRELLDLDTIPWPDREAIDSDRYLGAWKSSHGENSVNMITSRGCRYSCRWCSHSVYGSRERRRSYIDCADEAQWIIERYNPDQLWYADDVFTMDHEWLFSYSNELNLRGINIPFETISRADRMQEEAVIAELASMGCKRIWIGSESGSDKILRAMGRGVTAAQVLKAVSLCKNYGIETGVFLMWGYEGETPDDIALTVEHVKRCKPDIFFTTLVHPIGSTKYYQDIKHKLIFPENWGDSSDKDLGVRGRKSAHYYKAADRWLKNAVKSDQLKDNQPGEASRYADLAEEAEREVRVLWDE